jgi:hypothetical protein
MKTTTFTLAAVLAATTSMARRLPDDNCCTVWAGQNFMSLKETYCLQEGLGQEAFPIQIWRDYWNDGSIKCGKNVDALVCLGEFEKGPVDGQRDFGYKCDNGSIFVEHGTDAGAGQQLGYIPVERSGSSIVLSLHPWVAKGAQYLSLDRDEKEYILWNKITENENTNENLNLEFFDIDIAGVFDEFGDEFDCRHKTVHPQGNVGKAEWKDLGGHNYTGIFQGADTGFVRLSTQVPVILPEEREEDE